MRLYNLTDKPLPGHKKSINVTLRKAGIVLNPGGYVDLPASAHIGQVHGWVSSGWVAIDKLPYWYEAPKVVIEVGAMIAEIKAGPDGIVGTEDDETTIRPKPRSKHKKRGGSK